MDGGRILAIEKNSLPQLEIYEEPEPVGVLRDSGPVLVGYPPDRGGIEQAPVQRPRA